MENLKIDGARLWDSLMEMAQIGATEKGGVNRLALTDLDRESRDLFTRWCEAAGCTVTYDAIGNMFARRPGRDESLPPVMTGSHLDSQPTGGKFDGAYGVLAGLEVVRAPVMEQVALGIEVGSAEVACRGFAQERLARPFVARSEDGSARNVGFFAAAWKPPPSCTKFRLPRNDGCRC